ncbi:peptidase domain-containing ABC transporter [Psychroserpens sp.]|uniref:peptidase domain-containing ABC transporter n=1 Tax=Psychroserpens sp. TaxID=2020870 RepID=UPI001B17DA0A|nr:ATP-binding cassette domain-containing protein [Psychroserpens sp.]MBO6606502.1 ATP-binding cassette domain-containing protein [Psychroserpens sp.]MBO6630413.1 ATP-binding cassette domain-containing protein [Psychroserpens sp.]MBO6653206.1 ATP-binding cassette domain-containing protein [Psychroserpens sp.]MBO6680766.1 ATP-binding cassette domain-containing protein [Psychroserpens sp.]MBO6750276.1 ATP-binding cassette domain-containing protein [Psychroserpens sp.]
MTKILTSWQHLIGLLKLDRKDIKQIFYYAIFAGVVNLSLPLGIQAIINLIQGAQISTSWIVLVILVTIGVAFVGVLQLMQMRIIENVQQKIFTRSSFEFSYRFPKIKMSELRHYYPPELANRFFDTLTVQKGLSKILIDFPAAILQIVFGLMLLSFYHPFFIIYGILLILLVYVVFKFSAQQGLDTSIQESQKKYRVAHWLQEIARSVLSFKLSGQTSLAVNKNDALTADYLDAREGHFKILIQQFIKLIGFKVLVTAGLLIIGGFLVLNQQMNIGQFVAAEIIILLVISSVEKLILGLESFYDVLTSMEKLGEVVDRELEPQKGDMIDHSDSTFKVELEHVCYSVPDKMNPILSDISVIIEPKDRIMIHGSNGSGKSTLLKLISGILEPSKGTIYINDIDLKGMQLNDYRSMIGQSLPEETPFEGTIRDNLTFGDDSISSEEINHVLQKTGLLNFVKSQPQGLRTMLYPEGKKLSLTASKKIVLARSILKKPKLLLLKDPLEQFENEEAHRIMDFLTDPSNPWALVIVSYNMDWKTKCTRIINLENGRIELNQ